VLYYDIPSCHVVATAIYAREKGSLLDYEVGYRGYRAREITTDEVGVMEDVSCA